MIRSVLDYLSPQDAFDAADHGDAIYFPGIRQYVAPVGGWRISKSVEVYGDGPGKASNGLGTVLKPSMDSPPPGGSNHVLVLDPSGLDLDNVAIRDLCIMGEGVGGDGIHLLTGSTNKLSQLRVLRVAIVGMGGAGISLEGVASGSFGDVVGAYLADCEIRGCGAEGIWLKQAFQVLAETTRLVGNGREGIKAVDTEIMATMCVFDGNCATGGQAQFLMDRCSIARVDACRVVAFGGLLPAVKMLSCQGSGQVGGCLFDLGEFLSGSVGMMIGPPNNGPVLVLPNRFVGVDTAVDALSPGDPPFACVVMPQFCQAAGSMPIKLATLNAATLAIPGVFTPDGNRVSGLLIPSLPIDPGTNVQGGALAYVDGDIKAFVGGTFKKFKRADPPAAISDLTVGNPRGKTSLFVTWTAPLEPSWTGPVLDYDIRYSQAPITDVNFGAAMQFPVIPPPTAPGTSQCASLTGLTPCTTYYFAIKCQDHSGQTSPISNLPSGGTRCSGTLEVGCSEP